MQAVHPCPSCRHEVEHEARTGTRVVCHGCGASLRYIRMFEDGNLILVDPSPPAPAPG